MREGLWFGGPCRPLFFLGQMSVEYGGVTALVIYYNEFGFAVAADGFQRWKHQPTRSTHIRAMEKSDAQKIFDFRRDGIDMAYGLCGDIASEDRSFDLEQILVKELALLDTKAMLSCYEMIEVLAESMQHRLRQLGRCPEAYVPFFGYFRSEPSWIELSFRPPRRLIDRLYDLKEYLPDGPAHLNSCFPYVPDSLLTLSLMRDPRYPKLWTPPDPMKMDEAVAYVREYVEVCVDTEAIESANRTIGGRIHVAVVLPETGLAWRIKPHATPIIP
jgi:hypothetical protein